jgi:hypothetical protein
MYTFQQNLYLSISYGKVISGLVLLKITKIWLLVFRSSARRYFLALWSNGKTIPGPREEKKLNRPGIHNRPFSMWKHGFLNASYLSYGLFYFGRRIQIKYKPIHREVFFCKSLIPTLQLNVLTKIMHRKCSKSCLCAFTQRVAHLMKCCSTRS